MLVFLAQIDFCSKWSVFASTCTVTIYSPFPRIVGLEKFTSMKSSRLSRADRDRENISILLTWHEL